jgi:hypothetical protein
VSILRRRGREDGQPAAPETIKDIVAAGEAGPDDAEADQREVPSGSPLSPRPQGPWDAAERPEADGFVDLGALRIRGRDGMELRLEVEEATGSVTAATIQLARSAVQLQAFAAPRSEGIWDEIRAEIAAGITKQGGTADEVPGVFGRELLARVPVRSADGRTGHQPARFAGIDGPRWFLRAVFHGAAVNEPEAAAELESVVRDVVVVRGAEAMAPRELLALRLPEAAGGPAEGAEPQPPSLDPFTRGPEITEIR